MNWREIDIDYTRKRSYRIKINSKRYEYVTRNYFPRCAYIDDNARKEISLF